MLFFPPNLSVCLSSIASLRSLVQNEHNTREHTEMIFVFEFFNDDGIIADKRDDYANDSGNLSLSDNARCPRVQ